MSMFREHGLPWKIVGFFSLALAPPGLRWAQAQQVPQGLDEVLSGQVAVKPEPKRETPRIVLAPEFWSPSPSQSDFIRELRETETAKLPSADTPYPEADPNASTFRSKNPPLSPERTIAYVALADPAPGTSLDQRCEQIRAEIEAELARIEKNGTPQGKEAVAAACVNVWARHEGARLAGMLDPKSDVYQQRLARCSQRGGPGRPISKLRKGSRSRFGRSTFISSSARVPFRPRPTGNDSRRCLRRGGMRRPSKRSRRGSARNSGGSPWDSRLAWVARKSTSRSMPGSSGRIAPRAIATPGSTNCVTSCCPNATSSVVTAASV